MRIIRYQSADGQQGYGCQHADGAVTRLSGDLYDAPTDAGTTVEVAKLLSPVEPRDIFCIGLNYRRPSTPWCS